MLFDYNMSFWYVNLQCKFGEVQKLANGDCYRFAKAFLLQHYSYVFQLSTKPKYTVKDSSVKHVPLGLRLELKFQKRLYLYKV